MGGLAAVRKWQRRVGSSPGSVSENPRAGLATYRLAPLQQTWAARGDGEGPNGPHARVAWALLPYALARRKLIQLVTKLAPLGPSQLTHVPFGKTGQGLRWLGGQGIAGRGPQRLRL